MKKHHFWVIVLLTLLLFLNCRGKEKTESFFPVNSIIQGQLNDIDTSLYSIIKITYIDSSRSDTDFIRREEIRGLAADFLTIPELTKKKYTEENIAGPLDGVSTFIYKPIHADKEELKQVELIIDPSLETEGKSQITTIIIEKMSSNKDSLVEKKLLWQIDKSFQITTLKQLPGQPEVYSSYKVIWSGVNDE